MGLHESSERALGALKVKGLQEAPWGLHEGTERACMGAVNGPHGDGGGVAGREHVAVLQEGKNRWESKMYRTTLQASV